MVRRNMRQRLLALLFPERCCCCGKPVPCGGVVCGDCRPRLKRILPPLCRYCGCALRDCGCGKHKRHTERCAAPFYYEGAGKSALHRLKFGGREYAAEMFCLSMAETVKREYNGVRFDCIVPVPLSPSIKQKRHYNQSLILARGLSGLLGIPCADILMKKYETTPQRELPAYRRSGNVLGVFDLSPAAELRKESSVLLVDDTITTGATLDECAKILKLYGAGAVYAVAATASRLSETEI